MGRRRWTEEETQFLKIHYAEKGTGWCAGELGRSSASVNGKVFLLGLKREPRSLEGILCAHRIRNEMYAGALWRDRGWLREHYLHQQLSARQVAEFAGTTYKTITQWVRRFGWEVRPNAHYKSLQERREMRAKYTREMWQNPEHRNSLSGKNHHAWTGGTSRLPYLPEFYNHARSGVVQRDGGICQMCGKRERANGREMSVHHINYDRTDNRLLNLVSLCLRCHGRTNFHRDFWMRYLTPLITRDHFS
jgi:hypothetical protein